MTVFHYLSEVIYLEEISSEPLDCVEDTRVSVQTTHHHPIQELLFSVALVLSQASHPY